MVYGKEDWDTFMKLFHNHIRLFTTILNSEYEVEAYRKIDSIIEVKDMTPEKVKNASVSGEVLFEFVKAVKEMHEMSADDYARIVKLKAEITNYKELLKKMTKKPKGKK